MKKEGFVALWVGKTKSAEELNNFLKITYDEDGDYVPSIFARAFKTGRYDDDFREAKYCDHLLYELGDLPSGFSYYDTIMPKLKKDVTGKTIEPFNSAIFLYNFEYDGIQKSYTDGINNFIYVGTVEYK